MRLREPFAGYNLIQGHALFHVAYFIGGYYAVHYVLDYEKDIAHNPEAEGVLNRLNYAHVIVPIFMIMQAILTEYQCLVSAKFLEIISIF